MEACRWGHRRRLEHRSPARGARRAAACPLGTGDAAARRGRRARRTHLRQKLAQAAEVVAGYAEDARSAGVEELEVLITSPGRQAANGDELLEVLALAARCPVRVLSSAEEGRLAFVGAVGLATPPPGGRSPSSTSAAAPPRSSWGRAGTGRAGSSRSTSARSADEPPLTDEPPGEWAVRRASAEVARYLDASSRRAPHGLRGRRQRPCAEADRRPAARSRRVCVPARSRRLDAGRGARRALRHRRRADANGRRRARSSSPPASELLDTPLKVVRGGLRDGAVAELAERRVAA